MTPPLANLEESRGDYDAVEAALRGSARGRAFLAEFEHRMHAGAPQPIPPTEAMPEAISVTLGKIARDLHDALADLTAALDEKPIQAAMSAVAEEAQDIAWTFRERDGDRGLSERLDWLSVEIASNVAALGTHEIADGIDVLRAHVEALMLLAGVPQPAAFEPEVPMPKLAEPEAEPNVAAPGRASPIDLEAGCTTDVRHLTPAEALLLFS